MTMKEIRALSNDSIIVRIWCMGIIMSGGRQTKKQDNELMMYLKELEKRGVIESAQGCYERTF